MNEILEKKIHQNLLVKLSCGQRKQPRDFFFWKMGKYSTANQSVVRDIFYLRTKRSCLIWLLQACQQKI